MLVEQGRERCPELVTARYAFDKYEQTSRTLFRLLMGFTHRMEIVSCEEAFLDLTDTPLEPGEDAQLLDDMDMLSGGGDNVDPPDARVRRAQLLATRIRAAIEQATGCTASIGASDNMLLARMATEDAKPDGQQLVFDHNRLQFLATRKVEDLPGVGSATKRKFADLGIHSCSDLLAKSEEWLRVGPPFCWPRNDNKLTFTWRSDTIWAQEWQQVVSVRARSLRQGGHRAGSSVRCARSLIAYCLTRRHAQIGAARP